MMRNGEPIKPLDIPIRRTKTQRVTYVDKTERHPKKIPKEHINMNNDEKKILWISRHPPTKDQIDELEEILGECKIRRIARHFQNAYEVKELIAQENPDEVVAVLPDSILRELTALKIKPIVTIGTQIYENGRKVYKHDGYEVIDEFVKITHPLRKRR